jgi:hypothetical protein
MLIAPLISRSSDREQAGQKEVLELDLGFRYPQRQHVLEVYASFAVHSLDPVVRALYFRT